MVIFTPFEHRIFIHVSRRSVNTDSLISVSSPSINTVNPPYYVDRFTQNPNLVSSKINIHRTANHRITPISIHRTANPRITFISLHVKANPRNTLTRLHRTANPCSTSICLHRTSYPRFQVDLFTLKDARSVSFRSELFTSYI